MVSGSYRSCRWPVAEVEVDIIIVLFLGVFFVLRPPRINPVMILGLGIIIGMFVLGIGYGLHSRVLVVFGGGRWLGGRLVIVVPVARLALVPLLWFWKTNIQVGEEFVVKILGFRHVVGCLCEVTEMW